ncbi:MAG TPA: hypothetical protein VIR31_05830 [Nitrososphaeraceae archaeon]
MKNQEVINNFIMGNTEKGKGSNLFFENDVLYSYGYHFPLCLKINHAFIINSNSYSMTTAIHKGKLVYSLTNMNYQGLLKAKKKGEYNNIILLPTDKLKQVIELKPQSLQDLKEKMSLINL